ncbi:MAG: sulfur carrier protein ThiS [Actinomycetota bacterium]|nr:sulfur carrier protein ThiS [Actinomycetota bacterium]
MNVVVNGHERDVPDNATVADLIKLVGHAGEGRGIAAARNGEVVNRHKWSATAVKEGDRVEILGAVQGG